MKFYNWVLWSLFFVHSLEEVTGADDSYNTIHRDGSYEFGYNNPDSYHYADANRNNVVKGEFGGRNPATGAIDTTVYTAGPRGFRPRGKNVVRKYDLNQAGPRPVGSPDDPYYDPFEDPSYNFSFKTRTYTRQENANRAGDVTGKYSYVDDVGERHNVEFIAGKNTGFHVKTPFPDSNPRAYGPLYFNGRGKPIPRGRTSIQRGLDGSYRFVSAGPDQRRTETSDATGHVRGSYTYLDDKGVQHSVHYIAGPGIGYRVLKTVKGPHLPTVFPFGRPEIIPPDFYNYDKDVFDTAASGHIKPGSGKPISKDEGVDSDKEKGQDEFTFGNKKPVRPSSKPTFDRPSYTDEGETDDFGDLFGEGGTGTGGSGSTSNTGGFTTTRPSKPTLGQIPSAAGKPSGEDDGSYKPSSAEDGSYKPVPSKPTYGNLPRPGGLGTADDGSYKPRPTKPSYGNLPRPGGLGSTDDGSYKPSPTKPGYGDLPRPGGSTISTLVPSTTASGVKPSAVPGSDIGVDYGEGYGAGKPTVSGEGSNEVGDDFGLFGSETGNARPPFGTGVTRPERPERPVRPERPIRPEQPVRPDRPLRPERPIRPVIHVGSTDESCKRCAGTIVTNVGDKLFTVPPGVSVRAHVQAIDLVPISPSVPSPSEQYKAETNLNTEQLSESSNQIISTNSTENESEETVTETTITTTSVPNT